MSKMEDALLLIRTFRKGLKEGVKHYHPKTGDLLETVKDILETITKEGTVEIKKNTAN